MTHPTPRDRGALLDALRDIVGAGHVLTADRATRRFTKGFRYGGGPVACVVRPGSLVEMWRVLNSAITAGRAVIFQAANTGLTGGSTPQAGLLQVHEMKTENGMMTMGEMAQGLPLPAGEAVTLAPGSVPGKAGGLTFLLDAYAVGPYVEGAYYLTLPLSAFQSALSPDYAGEFEGTPAKAGDVTDDLRLKAPAA